MKISQSLIKAMQSYLDGRECGKVVEFQYVHGHITPAEGVLKEGQYFEFIATGALPKDGKEPIPEYLSKKKRLWTTSEIADYMNSGTMPGNIKTPPAGLEDRQGVNTPLLKLKEIEAIHKDAVEVQSMTAEYRRAWLQAQEFKRQCEELGIEILSVQEVGERDGLTGIRDISFRWTKDHPNWKRPVRKGETGTIDLKYSGLIHDQYNPMGWKGLFSPDENFRRSYQMQMDHHKIQAIQYGHIFDQTFYNWVFSSATTATETKENILLEMSYDEFELDQHMKRAKFLWVEFEFRKSGLGSFEARPSYNKCLQCPFFEMCDKKQVINEPVLVKIVSE